MKKILKNIGLATVLTAAFMSCEEPVPTHEIRLDSYPLPTIEFVEELGDTVSLMVEDGFPFELYLEAKGGIKEVYMNEEKIHISPYGQLFNNITHTFVMPDVEDTTVAFTIYDEDVQSTVTRNIVMKAEGRLSPDYLLSDLSGEFMEFVDEPIPNQGGGEFAGRIASSGEFEMTDYTIRALWTRDADAFNSLFTPNADAPTGDKALKIVKSGTSNNIIMNLGMPIPEVFIQDIESGKRAIQFDLYFDDTADPIGDNDFATAAIFDIYLCNFNKYKNDKAGIFDTYTAAIPEKNGWYSVVFAVKDGGRRTGDVGMSEIDAISIKPSMGLSTQNPYYIKNFRIVKVN